MGRVEQTRLQTLRAEARRDELSGDLSRLGVNLTRSFLASCLRDNDEDVLVDARRQVGRIGQAQRLLDVLLDNAAARERQDSRGKANRRPPAQDHMRLGAIAVRLQQRPHAADRETQQHAGGKGPDLLRDSLQLREQG